MFERRLKIVAVAGCLFFLVIGFRLFSMQVVGSEHWKKEAARLATRKLILPARRGAIRDRHGVVLAEDRLHHDLTVRLDLYDDHSWECAACGRPAYTNTEKAPRRCPGCGGEAFREGPVADWSRLPALLGLTPKEFHESLAEAWREYERAVDAEVERREDAYERVRLADVRKTLERRDRLLIPSVPAEAVREVVLHPARYRGLAVKPAYRRSHVESEILRAFVGRVGPITADTQEIYRNRGYDWLSIWHKVIGYTGLEKGLESVLGSRNGWREVDRDRRGRVREIIDESPPTAGHDVTLSLDSRLQVRMTEVLREVVKVHGARGGALAALEPRTGEVLVLVSHAVEGEGGLNAGGQHLAVTRRMPGSVFKVVTALAGLESGTLDPTEILTCGAARWHNVGCSHKNGHGPVDLEDGIALSCNKFFARAAERLGPDTLSAIRILNYWAGRLGFGQRTGVEYPGESAGVLPTPEYRRALFEDNPEYWEHPAIQRGELWRVGYGQGLVLATPIQVARLMAIVGNGGHDVSVTLIHGGGGLGERLLTPAHVERVRRALRKVVTEGSAKRTGLDRFRAAGKTGTAEIVPGQKRHLAWFAGYAPAEAPRVAFACYLHDTPSYGAAAAGPVALALLREVLGP